jgi:uncharacterized repeat protein (TIGR03803 family)
MSSACLNRALLESLRKKASSEFGASTFKVFAALALLTSLGLFCTGSAIGQGFTNLHNFFFTNGTFPMASLILSSNTLYGTTQNYGGGPGGGYGSVFKMGTDGSNFTALHIFSGDTDGGNLNSSLVLANGRLYGTAAFGGGSNHGCVFVINANGTGLFNLYNFSALSTNSPGTNSDGAYPIAGLILSGGTLYGMANGGGSANVGNIFAVNTNGAGFTNLHNFNVSDGQYPAANLILSGNTLYGMTPGGGAFHSGNIFSVSTNGTLFTTLFNFPATSGVLFSNSDGAFPKGSLLLSGSTLYGTASEGGTAGNGTVFKINTDGAAFTVLHTFSLTSGALGTNSDGAGPQAELILSDGVLYGTTKFGGNGGSGTVFRLNTNGTGFATLYNFTAVDVVTGTNKDGAHPVSGLVLSSGVLYGTASAGGTAGNGTTGYGTVFSLLVPPTLAIRRQGTNVILTWATNFTGFNLQTATNLVPPVNWSAVAGQYSVTNPIADKQRFFRLVHP